MKNSILKMLKNKFFILTLSITLVTAVIFGGVCFRYYDIVKNTFKEESKSYLLEISKQMANNISRNINDNFSALQTIAISLEGKNISSFKEVSQKVTLMQQQWKYDKILLVDRNASSYDENGNKVRLNNDEYLQKSLVGRVPSMSASEMIEGKESVIFAIPINFYIGEINILTLAATYGLETFDTILSMSAFDGKGYGHIINKDGTVVIRSSAKNSFEAGYNILNSLENSTFNQMSLKEIRSDILLAKKGFTEFILNDAALYLGYMSLEINQGSLNDWRLITFVPVAAVSDKSTLLVTMTLLLAGFITVAFTVLLTIILIVMLKNRRRLEKIAYVDSTTGGNTIQFFNVQANKILQSQKSTEYALIYSNIEKFKILNEQYGKNKCDKLLSAINNGVSLELNEDECMGRLFADNFIILLKVGSEEQLLERIVKWKMGWKNYLNTNKYQVLPFIIEIGVYIINNDAMPLNQMIDKAKLSLTQSKTIISENIRIAFYDDEIGKLIKREKQLEDLMENALSKGEFLVYLQPKYDVKTERINGAEALARWNSEEEGMIYPNEFIPLFEKNGFIKQLDLYVFEIVCKTLKVWVDAGFEPYKISINCSRVHLKDINFLYKYVDIVNKYNIDFKNLEIEFTENIVFDNVEYFTQVIDKLKEFGFKCSMDDFGSGYSSLSLIQDIPVDTIKLDKVFFGKRAVRLDKRTESVVGSIIDMSKALSMTVVAEGVEEKEQVLMLKRLGCDLIQGYYFAKPMAINLFEKLAFESEITNGKGDNL